VSSVDDARARGGTRAGGPGVELYDTTLRDGAQQADLSYTVEDRLRILHRLDQVGFPFVEGGWPGANPRDTEFFRLAADETLKTSTLTAFGMTRRAGERADESQVLRDLLDAGTEFVCLVGKAWDLHVTEALRTDLAEGITMVRDSVTFLRAQGRRVFFDAEHFFDGYRANAGFAMEVLFAAEEAGAERLVLCDTNGGMLPFELSQVVRDVAERSDAKLGIHVHNDAGCAVANSLVAVDAGVFQVQGTINGYGERTGNADLIPITADLVLKMGATDALPDGAVEHLTELAHYVAEIANLAPDSRQPYSGRYAFTHKAGLHTSGVARVSRAYEHVPPETVGNRRGVVASDYGGGSTIRMKAQELGLELADDAIPTAVEQIKRRESQGYAFDVAEGSLELLLRRSSGWTQAFFEVDSYRVHVEERAGDDEPPLAEATVKVRTHGTRHIESAEGQGPVGALDTALRKALSNDYPELDQMELEDFRVRVLSGTHGTGAVVRVLIDLSNGEREWTTVGVSENIIEASWEALVDGYTFGLVHPRAATD
jgi:2-isopropylmalate synthase